MQIFVERTLKPITIFAASIFMLNLITLRKVSGTIRFLNKINASKIVSMSFQILKTAYSLFALLKNTQK